MSRKKKLCPQSTVKVTYLCLLKLDKFWPNVFFVFIFYVYDTTYVCEKSHSLTKLDQSPIVIYQPNLRLVFLKSHFVSFLESGNSTNPMKTKEWTFILLKAFCIWPLVLLKSCIKLNTVSYHIISTKK